jgi:hypothetical protein
MAESKKRALCFGVVSFFAFLVYFFSSANSVGFLDSGYIASAAYKLSIMFAPGFPAYMLIGHVFTKLPFGSVSENLHLLSNLAGALTIGLVYLVIHHISTSVKKNVRDYGSHISAMAGAFSLAFAYQFWSSAISIEVFALNNLVIVAIVYLTLLLSDYYDTDSSSGNSQTGTEQWLVISIFVLGGIAVGLNPTTAVVSGAALAWLSFYYEKIVAHRFLYLSGGVVMAAIVISIYSYFPIRANEQAFLNWGNPATLSSLYSYLVEADLSKTEKTNNQITEVQGFHGEPTVMVDSFWYFLSILIMQFNPLWWPIIGFGVWWLLKNKPVAFSMVSGIFILTFIF